MYVLRFTPDGLSDVKALPKNVKNSLRRELLRSLAADPYACSEELTGPLAGWHSFDWRNYRVVFRIFEQHRIIAIAGIGERGAQSRSNIYKRLEALAEHGRLAGQVLAVLREFGEKK